LFSKGAPLGIPGEIVPRLTDAIEKGKQIADPQDLVVICGSLFTVGEAMAYFDPETYQPDEL
jgi:dihydrofolate synthase/folylpolyglutamate synthase